MKLLLPFCFLFEVSLAGSAYRRHPLNPSWFKIGAGEPECGIYCPPSGKWASGEYCGPHKIFEVQGLQSDRIIGGENADPAEVPWQVSVRHLGEAFRSLVKQFGDAAFSDADTIPAIHFCGGSILNKNWVLSAAHCFRSVSRSGRVVKTKEGGDEREIAVILGHNERNGISKKNIDGPENSFWKLYGNQFKWVKKVNVHPDYGGIFSKGKKVGLKNDIAMVELKTPIEYPDTAMAYPYTTSVRPACLAHPDYELELMNEGYEAKKDLNNCQISGFGKTSTEGSILDEKKMTFALNETFRFDHFNKAKVSLKYNKASCEKSLQTVLSGAKISHSEVCALGQKVVSYDGKRSARVDTCTGDSGGPLTCQKSTDLRTTKAKYLRKALVGVVSHGIGCGQETPGIYERVTAHYGFIKKFTSDVQIYPFTKVSFRSSRQNDARTLYVWKLFFKPTKKNTNSSPMIHLYPAEDELLPLTFKPDSKAARKKGKWNSPGSITTFSSKITKATIKHYGNHEFFGMIAVSRKRADGKGPTKKFYLHLNGEKEFWSDGDSRNKFSKYEGCGEGKKCELTIKEK